MLHNKLLHFVDSCLAYLIQYVIVEKKRDLMNRCKTKKSKFIVSL